MKVRIKKVPDKTYSFGNGGKTSLPRKFDYVNAGGTHEENPHEGVQYGIASDGIPNLVEQGEAIYDDYVFSKRNKPTKADLKKAGLNSSYFGKSYADIAMDLSKEASERINDSISENGLRASMTKLRSAQDARNTRVDAAKAKREAKKQAAAMIAAQQAQDYQKAAQAVQLANALKKQSKSYADGGPAHIYLRGTTGIYYGDKNADNEAYKMSLANGDTPSDWLYNYTINDGIVSDVADWNNYRNYILNNWNNSEVQGLMSKYWNNWKEHNKDSKYASGDLSKELYEQLSSDDRLGYGYLLPVQIKNLYEQSLQAAVGDKTGAEAEQAKQDFIKGLSVDRNNLDGGNKPELLDTSLRYAPIAGNLSALLEMAGGPDHSISNAMIAHSSLPIRQAAFNPTSNYLTYNPIDTDYALNKYLANANSERQAIMQSAAGTGSAIAGLLAANRQRQTGFGDASLQMQQYNDQQKKSVGEFNAATDQFNASGLSNTSQYNAGLAANRDKERTDSLFDAFNMRDEENSAYQNARSANISNLYENLGAIGRENFNSNMVTSNPAFYYGTGKNGAVNYYGKQADGGDLMTRTKRRTKKRKK